MGQPKQIMSINGKPFISHCLDHLFACGISDVAVVLGAYRERVIPLIAGYPVKLVCNLKMESEMADSVRLGLFAVSEAASGVLVCLSDHPLVARETYRRLADLHLQLPDKILIPSYREKRGHPGLFPQVLIDQVNHGFHLRQIIDRNAQTVKSVAVDDSGILCDMDTLADYQNACRGKCGIAAKNRG